MDLLPYESAACSAATASAGSRSQTEADDAAASQLMAQLERMSRQLTKAKAICRSARTGPTAPLLAQVLAAVGGQREGEAGRRDPLSSAGRPRHRKTPSSPFYEPW